MINANEARNQSVTEKDYWLKRIDDQIRSQISKGRNWLTVDMPPVIGPKYTGCLPVPDKIHTEIMSVMEAAGYRVGWLDVGDDPKRFLMYIALQW